MTSEEKNLIKKLLLGVLDGQVGKDTTTEGGSTIWTAIMNGKIARYKQGPGGKIFNGRENERFEGTVEILKKWDSESEILTFFQKYGWLMKDDDVKAYSAKFKPKKN